MPPQIFYDVWFLPAENTWKDFNVLAYRDTGRLIVSVERIKEKGEGIKKEVR